jgi:hypothetical protein
MVIWSLPVLVARMVTGVFPGTFGVEDELPPHPVVKTAAKAMQDVHNKTNTG